MELINKKQDIQGTRYYFAGSFKFVTEDWQIKNPKQDANDIKKLESTEKREKIINFINNIL